MRNEPPRTTFAYALTFNSINRQTSISSENACLFKGKDNSLTQIYCKLHHWTVIFLEKRIING